MNVVLWARVSSLEQKEDGFSMDAQRRAMLEKAEQENFTIVKEFSAAESAKKGAARQAFNEMLSWVASNARKEKIEGILFHKLDRACRNMKDAVRLKELEDHGIKLFFVENQFGSGAAGEFTFNILASVAQFYSDNLKFESLKGMGERAAQGWLPTKAPHGYYNDPNDSDEPIKIDPEKSKTVLRIFDLYSTAGKIIPDIREILYAEGRFNCDSTPKFSIAGIAYILKNPVYIGQIRWHGRILQGKHKPLIDVRTFELCQDILKGKSHRGASQRDDLPLGGELFHCKHCGSSITGERVPKKLRDGTIRYHRYYRCASNKTPPVHPRLRWKEDLLEQEVIKKLSALRLPNEEITNWFRTALRASLADEQAYRKTVVGSLRKRETDLESKQSRLLDAFLNGDLEKEAYQKKNEEIKGELLSLRNELGKDNKVHGEFQDLLVGVFELTQKTLETWQGSNVEVRRELLGILSLNRTLDDASLSWEWRKPFDLLAEGSKFENGVAERI